MQFIEMSGFKMVLTGCVLLLTLNCYQLYGDDFRVYYDIQSKIVKTERIPDQSTNISIELSGIQTWEAATQIFAEELKIKEKENINKAEELKVKRGFYNTRSDNVFVFHNNIPITSDTGMIVLLEKIVTDENPQQEVEAFLYLGSLYDCGSNGNDSLSYTYTFWWHAKSKAKSSIKDLSERARALYIIAHYYATHRSYSNGEVCLKECLALAKRLGDCRMEAQVLEDLVCLYKVLAKRESFCYFSYSFDKILKTEEQLLNFLNLAQVVGDSFMKARAFEHLGCFYKDILMASYEISSDDFDRRRIQGLKEVVRVRGINSSTAENYFQQALDMSRGKYAVYHYIELKALKGLYEIQGNLEEAQKCAVKIENMDRHARIVDPLHY